jgi:arylsulfatase A-like enzyme
LNRLRTLLLLCCIGCVGCTSGIPEKPNIIFILADDMSYFDLSELGQQQFATPHIDKLLQEGVFFREAYAGSSECAPSRASLMTGMHMGHCRIRNNRSVRGQDHLLNEDATVAEMLKTAGYATGMVGKWGIGLPGTEGTPDRQGFDYAYGFYDQGRAHGFYPHYMMENGKVVPVPENYGFDMEKTYRHNRSAEGLHTYDERGKLIPDGVQDPYAVKNSQDLIHGKALQFIRDHGDSPFFLYYATQLPHGPCITPDLGQYKDKPWDQKHREWAAMMDHLDRNVGEIVETLDSLEIRKRTVLFFASDNGYAHWGYFNRPRWQDDSLFRNKGPWKGGKFLPLDGGVRVPFFVHWLGVIGSGSSGALVALYDFPATACALAGIKPPQTDGTSLLPVLLEKQLNKYVLHDHLYWENGSFGPQAQAVRFGDWYAFRDHPDEAVQLWNLISDVACEEDIAQSHPEKVQEALQLFRQNHEPSTWYVNPGDTEQLIESKRKKAEEEGSLQQNIRANSRYPEELIF